MENKTLHLNLHAKWFDMILFNIKKDEYRSMSDYWFKKLTTFFERNDGDYSLKEYTTITFSNGYKKNRRQFVINLNSIAVGIGNEAWGAPKEENVFILSLGNILSTKNI